MKNKVTLDELTKIYFWTTLLDEVVLINAGFSYNKLFNGDHLVNDLKKEKVKGRLTSIILHRVCI